MGNPPKTKFDATKEKELLAIVEAAKTVDTSALLKATGSPTPAPTSYPTEKGKVVKIKQEKVPAVSVEMVIAFTPEEIATPPVTESLKQGFGAALGFDSTDISIGKVTTSTRRGRRLQSSNVEFLVASRDPDTVTDLKKDIEDAAQEGSIIAHVKAAAATNGALTDSLKQMDNKPKVQVTAKITTKTIEVAVVENASPAAADTPPSKGGSESCDTGCKVGAAIGGVVGVLFVVALVKGCGTKKPAANTPTSPVKYEDTQGKLTEGKLTHDI